MIIKLTRTDNAPDIPNKWDVDCDEPLHSTSHDDLEMALLVIRVLAEGQQRKEALR